MKTYRLKLVAVLLVVLCVPALAWADQTGDASTRVFESGGELDEIDAQIEATEYQEANRVLESMIVGIEDREHRYHPDLVRPLTLLGDALRGLGDAPGALDAYQRAIHVDRVNFGLYSPGQVSIVYKEADTLRSVGDLQEATKREEYAYEVLQKAFGVHGNQLLPGVYHLADWYEKTYNIFAARALYEHAVRIYEANGQAGSLEMLPALRGLASTYRLERFPPFYVGDDSSAFAESSISSTVDLKASHMRINNFAAGEHALQQVVRILSTQPEPDSKALLQGVLDLADWYMLFEKFSRALPLYTHAFELSEEIEDMDAVAYFAQPKMLHFPVPRDPNPPPIDNRGEELKGQIEIGYAVSVRGAAIEMVTLVSEPEGLMDYKLRKSLRASRFRPALLDGEAIDISDQSHRLEFSYFEKKSDKTAPDADDI
ncbi:MAG: hypothetical protein O3A63_14065 [Proteobacteria bacterium]|nr:hypothetical protein [Pseudomonadota bacterium]